MCNLVNRLPVGSELYAERAKLTAADRIWTTTDYLLAHVVDLLQVNNYQFAAAHSRHAPPKPKPLQRPRDAAVKREQRKTWLGRTIYTPREG